MTKQAIRSITLGGAFFSAGFAGTSVHAQCEYEITAFVDGPEVCPFGSPDGVVIPTDLNDSGHVVGYWNCQGSPNEKPFVWTGEGTVQLLDLPVDNVTRARVLDINNNGDMCGWFTSSSDQTGRRAFVLDADEQFIEIPVPSGGTWVLAHAINDSGQVCGWWGNNVTGEPTGAAAFLWEGGELTTIVPIDKYWGSRAFDINESGQVTGPLWFEQGEARHAFLWSGGELTILPLIPNGTYAEPKAINNSAQVCGFGNVPPDKNPQLTIHHAYAASIANAQDLGGIDKFVESWASDLHDNGLVIGRCAIQSNGVGPACIWHRGQAFDLNDLLVDPPDGLQVQSAVAINASGQILGKTTSSRGIVLTPVDPPPADITGDCSVNVHDLITLLENWSESNSFADINNSGRVNVTDLLMLLSNWNP